MSYRRTILQKLRCFTKCAAAIAVFFLGVLPCSAQSTQSGHSNPAAQQPKTPWEQELKKYPGLLEEFGRLAEKIRDSVIFPPARGESRLLPLLPESTIFYAAFPNYGDAANQTLTIFRQELQESAVLRDWWQHGAMATDGPKLEAALEKFYQVQQYLGDEIALSASMEGSEPSLLIVTEVRKPGLRKFLQQLVNEHPADSGQDIRVLDLQELATATETGPASAQKPVVLVRSDFVVGAGDLATLRRFNAQLEARNHDFVASPFGQRVAHEYQGGLTTLAAADLGKILSESPPAMKQNASLQRSGFADVKYLVWDHKNVAGQKINQTELSFGAPRHGPASWLAKPVTLSNLDFVSPKAIVASTLVFTSFSQVFDDLRDLYTTPTSDPFAALPSLEKMLQLSLKDDLLRYLDGEVTVELDDLNPPAATWKTIFKVNDATALQKTLSTLLVAGHIEEQSADDGGVTYYTVHVNSANAMKEIGYAFVDGHLIVASSRDAVANAVRLHGSGESLGKSAKFVAALPSDQSSKASALFYQDSQAIAGLALRRQAPELADALSRFSRGVNPSLMFFYADATAIRETSNAGAMDLGAVLVGAAIAIPNLLRSKMAANEATAVGSVRTVNTAQITYSAAYPKRGYAPDLAMLGTDTRNPNVQSPAHAGFLSETLASESCTADAWCTKSGFRFRVTSICKLHLCSEYVIVATPVDTNTGTRSFCSTSEGVIRYKKEFPLSAPVSVVECKTWPPLQ
jgi:type IV pilus assembly protein PilA